jgi:hypothetical protein
MSQMPYNTKSLEAILTVQPGEVVIGKIANVDETGTPLVDYPSNPTHQPLSALTTVALSKDSIGRDVAILFAEGDLRKPIIMGLIHTDLEPQSRPVEARVDGKKVLLSADKEIVLKCGKASITLTRAGKIIIRGAYILNRSSGVNRIKGGSVQIN